MREIENMNSDQNRLRLSFIFSLRALKEKDISQFFNNLGVSTVFPRHFTEANNLIGLVTNVHHYLKVTRSEVEAHLFIVFTIGICKF